MNSLNQADTIHANANHSKLNFFASSICSSKEQDTSSCYQHVEGDINMVVSRVMTCLKSKLLFQPPVDQLWLELEWRNTLPVLGAVFKTGIALLANCHLVTVNTRWLEGWLSVGQLVSWLIDWVSDQDMHVWLKGCLIPHKLACCLPVSLWSMWKCDIWVDVWMKFQKYSMLVIQSRFFSW